MSGRPPVAPTQHFRAPSDDDDEEKDQVTELDDTSVPVRSVQSFSPLNPSDYVDRIEWHNSTPIYIAGNRGPVVLCLHGAGHSGLSYACLSKVAKSFATLVSFDFRAHGSNPEEGSLDADTLVSDTLSVIDWVKEKYPEKQLIIIGHSMGGAIAAKASYAYQQRGGAIAGLIMLDVVEGSALEALPHMDTVISKRPKSFPTVENAIKWAIQANYIKNRESARVSIPSQVKEKEGKYVFITDLKETRPFWQGWFEGMNNAFLAVDGPKQLIIAGSDRTDRQMMIAQMQGKFKHTVFFNVGHVIQEDDFNRLANEISTFIDTFRLNTN